MKIKIFLSLNGSKLVYKIVLKNNFYLELLQVRVKAQSFYSKHIR